MAEGKAGFRAIAEIDREALDELREAAGKQFCPRCVGALERILPIDGITVDGGVPPALLVAS